VLKCNEKGAASDYEGVTEGIGVSFNSDGGSDDIPSEGGLIHLACVSPLSTKGKEFRAHRRSIPSLRRLSPNSPGRHSVRAGTFYQNLLDNLNDAVYFVDDRRNITYWNRAAESLTGFSAADVLGMPCADDLLAHTNCHGTGLCKGSCPLAKTIRDGRSREEDVYLRHKKGHRIPVSIRVGPIFDGRERIIGAVEVFSDNTTKQEAEQKIFQLEQMAYLDFLTQIPNRRFLEMRLKQVLEAFRRYGHVFGLMLADLDDFKQINDQWGHAIGDSALVVTAQTLTRCLRAVDNVGRWGGDEFAAILPELTLSDLHSLAQRCRVLVEQSGVPGADGRVPVRISVGATIVKRGDTVTSLLHRADHLLYRSKRQGKGEVSVG